jgi:uncharacterized Tic20 family protein
VPIVVTCPSCKARLRTPDAALGKRIRCPCCQTAILVQDSGATDAPADPEDDLAELGKAPDKAAREGLDEAEDDQPRDKGRRRGKAAVSAGGPVSEEDKQLAFVFYLIVVIGNGLCGIGYPAGLIFWLVKRGGSKFMDYTGKQWLNHLITFFLLGLAGGSLLFILALVTAFYLDNEIISVVCIYLIAVFVGVLVLLDIILSVVALVKVKAGEWYRYPWTWRLLK